MGGKLTFVVGAIVSGLNVEVQVSGTSEKHTARVRPHRKKAIKKLLVGIMTIAPVHPATCGLRVGHKPSAQRGHVGGKQSPETCTQCLVGSLGRKSHGLR